MRPHVLWLPFVVPDLDGTVEFWERTLGLGRIDEWAGDGERGVVLRAACGAVIEFVEPRDVDQPPTTQAPAPPAMTVAFEVASRAEVWAAYATTRENIANVSRPTVHPRGHYGFTLRDPHGIEVLVWAEKEAA